MALLKNSLGFSVNACFLASELVTSIYVEKPIRSYIESIMNGEIDGKECYDVTANMFCSALRQYVGNLEDDFEYWKESAKLLDRVADIVFLGLNNQYIPSDRSGSLLKIKHTLNYISRVYLCFVGKEPYFSEFVKDTIWVKHVAHKELDISSVKAIFNEEGRDRALSLWVGLCKFSVEFFESKHVCKSMLTYDIGKCKLYQEDSGKEYIIGNAASGLSSCEVQNISCFTKYLKKDFKDIPYSKICFYPGMSIGSYYEDDDALYIV